MYSTLHQRKEFRNREGTTPVRTAASVEKAAGGTFVRLHVFWRWAIPATGVWKGVGIR
jgi:hypothetical protein